MAGRIFKALELQCLNLINCNLSLTKLFAVIMIVVALLNSMFLWRAGSALRTTQVNSCTVNNDNIGNKFYYEALCMPTIDVVYTWVNGSDPLWRKKLERYRSARFDAFESSKSNKQILFENTVNANTSDGSFLVDNSTAALIRDSHEDQYDLNVSDHDDVSGENRFRDNSELKYSLRSLEKYAPWVRKVFIVTDNQIPAWLNLENERVKVVSHREIFRNLSHLPTFSSPAIEANIHRIKGLANHFLYLNDDVMFGAPVMPTDFFTPSGGQKIFLAWDLPPCNEGCLEHWIGDGFCDSSCNVSECNFDAGDCMNKQDTSSENDNLIPDFESGEDSFTISCSENCPWKWLGDNICDEVCNTPSCGFDALDCGFKESIRQEFSISVVDLNLNDRILYLPYGTRALILNYTSLKTNASDSLVSASTNGSRQILQAIVRIPDELIVIVLKNPAVLGRNRDDTLLWGGMTQRQFIDASERCFSIMMPDVSLKGCPEGVGCRRFDSLEAAQFQCLLYGDICRGITENHNGAFELRREYTQEKSELGENSWLKIKCINSSNFSSILPEVVFSLRLDFAISGIHHVDISGALSFSHHVSAITERKSFESRGLHDESTTVQKPRSIHSLYRSSLFLSSNYHPEFVRSFGKRHSKVCKFKLLHNLLISRPKRRLDTYGDSLKYASSKYRLAFGASARRVPAHMAHFIQVKEVEEMQQFFRKEFEKTSSNQFRSSDDMQFAFSYMYWVVHKGSMPELGLSEYFDRELDTDHNGYLDTNEIRTLASVVAGKDKTSAEMQEVYDKIIKCISGDQAILPGHLMMSSEEFLTCEIAVKGVLEHSRRQAAFETVPDENAQSMIAFEMISDDLNSTLTQLDSIRARKPKFICINDDMKDAPAATRKVLHDFYESFFPTRSQFELPQHILNPSLYYDEYLALSKKHQWNYFMAFGILSLVFLLWITRKQIKAIVYHT